jgi:hypothetical protein
MKLTKRLIVLTILLILSFKTFSQNVTNTTTIQLEKPIARLVIKDLIRGDGVEQELNLTQDKVNILEHKIILKDNIISNLNHQIINYKDIIDTKSQQLSLSQELSSKLQNDLKKQQQKNKITTGVGVLGVLVVFFILR